MLPVAEEALFPEQGCVGKARIGVPYQRTDIYVPHAVPLRGIIELAAVLAESQAFLRLGSRAHLFRGGIFGRSHEDVAPVCEGHFLAVGRDDIFIASGNVQELFLSGYAGVLDLDVDLAGAAF